MVEIMEQFKLQHFEESAHENGVRYWFAHEFMTALGYESWNSFSLVINKAMGACAKLNIDVTDAFIPDSYLSYEGKKLKTFRLTRFACFLVAMYADDRKSQVAQAKAILSAIAAKLIEQKIGESYLGRIETREDLKLAERVMSDIAHNSGLEQEQFGIFKDAGFRGMYNMSLRDLKVYKGIDSNEILYDFMGLDELAGNLFRVTQTAARIKNTKASGLNQLATTAKEVGQEVRQIMIKNSGVSPENLLPEEDISHVKKHLKSAYRKMKQLDSPVKKNNRGKR